LRAACCFACSAEPRCIGGVLFLATVLIIVCTSR
jgi:hypothetical protein